MVGMADGRKLTRHKRANDAKSLPGNPPRLLWYPTTPPVQMAATAIFLSTNSQSTNGTRTYAGVAFTPYENPTHARTVAGASPTKKPRAISAVRAYFIQEHLERHVHITSRP
jgi:hypothetical protein